MAVTNMSYAHFQGALKFKVTKLCGLRASHAPKGMRVPRRYAIGTTNPPTDGVDVPNKTGDIVLPSGGSVPYVALSAVADTAPYSFENLVYV